MLITYYSVKAIIERSHRTIWKVVTAEGSEIPIPDRNEGYYLHAIAYGACLTSYTCAIYPDWPAEIKQMPKAIPEMLRKICDDLDKVAVTELPPTPNDPVWWKRLVQRYTTGREWPVEDLRAIIERQRTGRDMATELFAIPGVVDIAPGMRFDYTFSVYEKLCETLYNYPFRHPSESPAFVLYNSARETDELLFSLIFTQQGKPRLPKGVTLFFPFIRDVNNQIAFFAPPIEPTNYS